MKADNGKISYPKSTTSFLRTGFGSSAKILPGQIRVMVFNISFFQSV
jgi:hypothetical protein